MGLAIHNAQDYIPGKSIEQLKKELKCPPQRRIVKLASNENPLGPSPKAMAAVIKELHQAHRYPEPTSLLLREALSENLKVSPEEILITSGEDEALRLIAETFLSPDDCCVVSQYTFSRYRQHAQLMSSKVMEIPLVHFKVDLQEMGLAALKYRAKVVFIANPNNPTATFNSNEELKAFFELLGPQGPLVILDEAYGEFARDAYPEHYPQSIPSYFEIYPNLIVLRTLSKIMGLAGMRIGYCVGKREFIAAMNKARLVFNVTSLSQAAALASLKDQRHYQNTLRTIAEGRIYLERQLRALGFKVVGPGAANFILAQVPWGNGQELYLRLLDQGIIIRSMVEQGLESYVRISIGTLSENKILAAAFKKFFP